MSACQVHFAGPDGLPHRLRDLLAERVGAVPAGGSIDWVTYYFRDRRLAAALIEARRRGVVVRVTLDAHPRTARANDAVIAQLGGAEGIGAGLRAVRGAADARACGRFLRPRLHEKLYCFSHPRSVALLGSFNPSGDEPEEDPAILSEIGDHDRGFDLLVEVREAELANGLQRHARALHRARHGPWDRFASAANDELHSRDLSIHFWPRARANPVVRLLRRAGRGARMRIAASHLSGPSSQRALLNLVRGGAEVSILAEPDERRVPPRVEARLVAGGIRLRRVVHPDDLPMHDKFILLDTPDERRVVFGSFNWTEPSRHFNREIGAISGDPALYAAFEERWSALEQWAR